MTTDLHRTLPTNDYVSPGLHTIMPDVAFPNMIVGDTSVPRWPYLRRWVEQNWYTDRRNPAAGFASRDEAAILYNSALLFRGKPCLEVGCWRGWSAVHLALGSGVLDIIDPVFDDPDFADSITASCEAAGVLDQVTFHTGLSPGAIDTLAQSTGKHWSLIFIDADHEGDAPRLDAEAAMRNAADTAMVLFHDLASPYVAAGLDAMRNAGWRTMVYQTMQIMGVAWRGNVDPVAHVPDPKVFWTLPRHLSGYEVSGWKRPALPADGAAWVGMTIEDRRDAAMMRAQAAEDELAVAQIQRDAASARAQAAENALATGLAEQSGARAERDAALVLRDQALTQRDAASARAQAAENALATGLAEQSGARAERDAALVLRDQALTQRDAIHASVAHLGGQLAELTTGIVRKNEAEAAHALASHQDAALHRLVQWVLRKRVLLGLLRRSPVQRTATIHGEAATLGIADIITDPFVHWLCRRRILIGLLRHPARLGEAAVLGRFQATQEASQDEKALAAKILPAHLEAVHLEALQCAGMAEREDADRTLIEQSDLFDAAYYGSKYSDLAGIDLLEHYLKHGGREGRSPGPGFDGCWYLSRNPEVARRGENPLLHYLRHGACEGREPVPRTQVFNTALQLFDDVSPFDSDLCRTIERNKIKDLTVYQPPGRTPLLDAWERLFASLERAYDTIIFVPWLVRGGADLVATTAAKAAAERHGAGSVLVVITDHDKVDAKDWLPREVEVRILSEIRPDLSHDDRVRLVEMLIFVLSPRAILNVNSRACWDAIKRRGRALSRMTRLFACLFCRDYLPDGRAAGYADTHFRACFLNLQKIYFDNRAFAQTMIEENGIPESFTPRIVVLRLPVTRPAAPRGFQRADQAGRPYVLWAGRFCKQKNVDLFIEIAKRSPEFHFHVYGDGDGEEADRLRDAANQSRNMTLLGRFSSFDALPTSDYACLLFTSLWEGLPTTLINAAPLGIPIVASDVGGIVELVDAQTGWLVHDYANPEPYISAIEEIWRNPVEAAHRVEQMQERVRTQHSWATYIDAFSQPPSFLED